MQFNFFSSTFTGGWSEDWRVMLNSTQDQVEVEVEVEVELGSLELID